MKTEDKQRFAMAITSTFVSIYEKPVTELLLEAWFNAMKPFNIDDFERAMGAHVSDPEHGRFAPKPADIIRQMQANQPDDGHPGAEEAWGIVLKFASDERETGVYTEPMRRAWEACGPMLSAGDEIGARMCFLEVYRKAVAEFRQNGIPAKWQVTLGTDKSIRAARLHDAVAAGRLTADRVRSMLPGPSNESIESVAGLLSGPGATKSEIDVSQRLRELAAMLRAGSDADKQQREQQRVERRAREDEQKRKAAKAVQQRTGGTEHE